MRLRARVTMTLLAAVAVGATCTTGSAAAASLRSTAGGYRYVASTGEANVVEATLDGSALVLPDTGAPLEGGLPKGCTALAATTGFAASCRATGQQDLRFELGDGDDSLTAWELTKRFSLRVTTGDGTNV